MRSLRFLLWTLLAYIAVVEAGTKTFIVDDAATNLIIYSKGWNVGNLCGGCAAKPDKDKPRDGTWHDGTESPDRLEEVFFTFTFTGTSVEARYIAIDLIGLWTTNTNVSYSIDGGPLSVTQREPKNQTDYLYDQLLFRIDGLSNVEHTLRVDIQQPGVLLLDYLKYTEEIADVQTTTSLGGFSSSFPSPSSSPTFAFDVLRVNVGAIIGGVLFGVLVLVVVFTSWCCLKRRRKRAQARLVSTPMITRVPPLYHPYPPRKPAGQVPYNLPPTEYGDGDLYRQSISSQPIYSRLATSSELPSYTLPGTLDTLQGSSMSALVSHSSRPPRPGRFHSASNKNQITSPLGDEPVEQGLMSRPYSPQNLPPPYNRAV